MDWGGAVSARHSKRANILMADGHVGALSENEIRQQYRQGVHKEGYTDAGYYFQWVCPE